jgi:hypothetical protein
MQTQGRVLVSKRTAALVVATALSVGMILIVLGTMTIEGARQPAIFEIPDGSGLDFAYYAWDVSRLVTGIVLALMGTASGAASLTYLEMTRKKKGVGPSLPEKTKGNANPEPQLTFRSSIEEVVSSARVVRIQGRISVLRRIAVHKGVVAFVAGCLLVALGTATIIEAQYTDGIRFGGINWDGIFIYDAWDVFKLVTGIILALGGVAAIAASLTYLILTRKKKVV